MVLFHFNFFQRHCWNLNLGQDTQWIRYHGATQKYPVFIIITIKLSSIRTWYYRTLALYTSLSTVYVSLNNYFYHNAHKILAINYGQIEEQSQTVHANLKNNPHQLQNPIFYYECFIPPYLLLCPDPENT